MGKLTIIAVAALALSGCSVLQPSDKDQLAVQSAGDAGAFGCAAFAIEASPGDVQKAKVAANAAKTVLSDDNPDLSALQAALTGNMPEKWVPLGAAFIARLRVRLGDAQVIDKDSVAFQMAESFVGACQMSLAAA